MADHVVLLERIQYGHPLAGLLWERQFKKVLLEHEWDKVPNSDRLFVTQRKDYSCLCTWMTSNWLEKKHRNDPVWKVLNKQVDLGEPTSFLDHVDLGCTQKR